jgi:uncharacterized membrane protein YiaA
MPNKLFRNGFNQNWVPIIAVIVGAIVYAIGLYFWG